MFLSQGTKRKLIINNVEMKDTGEITAKTNKDKSTAPLNVGILNEIMKEVTSDAFRSISGMVFAVEREELAIYVTVKDPNAPVYFYINGSKIDEGSFRYSHTNNKGNPHTRCQEVGADRCRNSGGKDSTQQG